MFPILDGYGVTGIFQFRARPGVNCVGASWRVTLVAYCLAS
jgi:hypothetical protein